MKGEINVIVVEFFGPLSLLLGFAVRFWSIAIGMVMTGVILTTFTDHFFMNWFGTQPGEGMEFFLLAIGMALTLVIIGAGKFSIDRFLFNKSVPMGHKKQVTSVAA